jgi:hypothetical protein
VWVSEGLNYKFVLKDSTGTTIGTYDNINGTYVAADLANTTNPALGDALVGFRQSTPAGNAAGAVARTVHQKFQETVSVLDFGADPSGVADSLSAFQAAIASFPATYDAGVSSRGGVVLVPPGTYYLSGTLELNRSIILTGVASAFAGYGASTLTFADNVNGLFVPYYTTSSTGKMGAGLTIENLILNRKTTSGTLGSGIFAETRVTIRNCSVAGFRVYGIYIKGSSTSSPATNANTWFIENTSLQSNGSHGLYVLGADSNAGSAHGLLTNANGGWGVYDSSFLGNTYIGCTSETNTLGSYATTSLNARNMFVGCYAEPDQPAASIIPPSMAVGGFNMAVAGNPFIDAGLNGLRLGTIVDTGNLILGYNQSVSSGIGLTFKDTSASQFPWDFSKTTGRWGYNWANLTTPAFVMFYDSTATPANGYAVDISSATCPSGGQGALGIGQHYFGNYTQMKWRGLNTAAPTTGAWNVGDIVYNSAPTAGGTIGWVCTTAGTPGTWKTFGAISA